MATMESTDVTTLGEKIRTLRKDKRMSLDDLASKAGLSKSYLWELENKDALRPSAEKLMSVADVLGMPLSFFMESSVAEPEERHLDEALFRHYSQLDPADKVQIRKIIETFRKPE